MNKQTTTIWQLPKISPLKQREGFYCEESMSHPAKMPPHLAQSAILTYTEKNDRILDVMTGIGTTVIEAVKLDRNAIGVDCEKRFVDICNKNLAITKKKLGSGGGNGLFIKGDARKLSNILNQKNFDSIIFSPPYENVLCKQKGNSSALCKEVFGYMVPYSEEKSTKENKGEVNIGLQKGETYLGEMLKVYKECYNVLKPDGFMILVVRNFRRKGEEIDLRTNTIQLCKIAGFKFFQTCMHILNDLSFWQKINTKKVPCLMLNVTEYILVFKK
ncbi:MAG: class I SAM-dependent methyltransferase [Candidatus Omnitrophica bacterium]|nr:class I SAM-dependent methyltransferase [Candidatus Omnitrophota bacterium]